MKNQQPEKPPTTPRTPDAFQIARRLYLARKRLFAKAAELLDGADESVLAMVEAHEESDAAKIVDVEPSSPSATRDTATQPS